MRGAEQILAMLKWGGGATKGFEVVFIRDTTVVALLKEGALNMSDPLFSHCIAVPYL